MSVVQIFFNRTYPHKFEKDRMFKAIYDINGNQRAFILGFSPIEGSSAPTGQVSLTSWAICSNFDTIPKLITVGSNWECTEHWGSPPSPDSHGGC